MIAVLVQATTHADPGGFYLLCFLAAAVVLTWSFFRRVLRGLGTMLLALGVIALVAAIGGTRIAYGSDGAGISWPQIGGLIIGGIGFRVVGGLQPASWRRRDRRSRPGPKQEAARI